MENEENKGIDSVDVMDWDDELSEQDPVNDKPILLKEGDYNFLVTKLEKGRFSGSEKLPAAPKATISIQVYCEGDTVAYSFDLLLIKLEGFEKRLYGFFRSIGQKEAGKAYKMNWDAVIGSHGRGHFRPKSITNKNGEVKQVNDLVYFVDYDPKNFSEDEQLPF